MKVNTNYKNLKESYLFSEIAARVAEFSKAHPEKEIIRMGIGDVTLPLCRSVVDAMVEASEGMGNAATFHGYGPEQGYDFLREKIRDYYAGNGVSLEIQEIFISDGAKSDLGNILDLFDKDNTVLVPDPVYPVYVDTNIMDGRNIVYANANEENGFLPMPDES
ncbi:MAG: aminotransferase class I/II-fold pyridoxal phosphate-dependent enzyme, partial [Oscillospiraceae bacterium]|nr:aminotransferase class I/II-fold pyridoxal phosphate-dependent enzyme [Oscillospiraceae bacterium]